MKDSQSSKNRRVSFDSSVEFKGGIKASRKRKLRMHEEPASAKDRKLNDTSRELLANIADTSPTSHADTMSDTSMNESSLLSLSSQNSNSEISNSLVIDSIARGSTPVKGKFEKILFSPPAIEAVGGDNTKKVKDNEGNDWTKVRSRKPKQSRRGV